MIYRLINPSDPYTFEAPSIEVAGVCACLISMSCGAESADGNERTPILFGWQEWLDERGVGEEWMKQHYGEIADAFDSFLIGDLNARADVESMLALLPEDKRKQWKDERQNRHRSSLNEIGEAAYKYAARFRKKATELAEAVKAD